MTALNRFHFHGYTIRPAGGEDLALATQWNCQDKYHAEVLNPAFWLEQGLNVDSIVLSDGKGPVLIYKVVTRAMLRPEALLNPGTLPFQFNGLTEQTIREVLTPQAAAVLIQQTAEIFIQFMPIKAEEDRERTRGAMIHGLEWVERVLILNGIERIFFDTEDEKLLGFCRKRLGFSVDQSFKPGRGQRLHKVLAAAA